jgi:hypothetical protein
MDVIINGRLGIDKGVDGVFRPIVIRKTLKPDSEKTLVDCDVVN